MKFVDRLDELRLLTEVRRLSKKKMYTLVIYGLRRVGKTRLIEEFLGSEGLYFFVTKHKSTSSLLLEFEGNLKRNKVMSELEHLSNWDEFFEVLFSRYSGVVAFDEFQNIGEVDKSILSTMQKHLDKNEEKGALLVLLSGSVIGMMKKLFGVKEPLYGRIKQKMFLKPLNVKSVMEMCEVLKIRDFEEIIRLYSVFGGFPRYYVAIENENLEGKSFEEIIDAFFLKDNAIFSDEVFNILNMEFGKRKGIYYEILAGIACGKNTISELAAFLSKKENLLTRYINDLQNHFEMIGQEKQVAGDKKLYFIKNPLMNFWFKFFYKDLSLYMSRSPSFMQNFKDNLNQYIGPRFELFCREVLMNWRKDFDVVGKQWGKMRDKSIYEIDVVALDEKNRKILFAECKWKSNVNAREIMSALVEKAGYVNWNIGRRSEEYMIFAKSFREKITEFDGRNVVCVDLEALKKLL